MKIIELTGPPCAGKSTALKGLRSIEGVRVFGVEYVTSNLGLLSSSQWGSRLIYEAIMLWAGCRGAGARRLWFFGCACARLAESAKVRINIFRNIIHKYGVHRIAHTKNSDDVLVVDEGIAHLPFLFTGNLGRINESRFLDFPWEAPAVFKFSASSADLSSRLRLRGHKRLRATGKSIEDFVIDNEACSMLQDRLFAAQGVNVSVASADLSKQKVEMEAAVSAMTRDLPEPEGEDAQTPVDVALLRALFEDIRQDGLRVCSWKNNHLLKDTLECKRDLDLYVNEDDKSRFVEVLNRHGFIEGVATVSRHANIAHYYTYGSRARLRHLHVYYRLMTGESHLKDYRLPLEHIIAADCDLSMGWLPVPKPEMQKLVFLVRHFLKNSSLAGRLMSQREFCRYAAEQEALREITPLSCVAGGLSSDFISEMQRSLASGEFVSTWRTGRRLRRILRARRSLTPFQATWKRYANLVVRAVNKVLWNEKKSLVGRGRFIAITGLDGSGKSTLINYVTGVLGKDFTVHRFHLGKPPATTVTLPVRVALWLRSFMRRRDLSAGDRFRPETNSGSGLLPALRYAALAHERWKLSEKIARLREKGHVVLTDRYPSTTPGKMDSPRLDVACSGRLKRALAKYEHRCYTNITKPDLLIILEVSEATGMQRNQDRIKSDKETPGELALRYSENRGLSYDASVVKVLRNEMPLSQAMHEILTMVLDALRKQAV